MAKRPRKSKQVLTVEFEFVPPGCDLSQGPLDLLDEDWITQVGNSSFGDDEWMRDNPDGQRLSHTRLPRKHQALVAASLRNLVDIAFNGANHDDIEVNVPLSQTLDVMQGLQTPMLNESIEGVIARYQMSFPGIPRSIDCLMGYFAALAHNNR